MLRYIFIEPEGWNLLEEQRFGGASSTRTPHPHDWLWQEEGPHEVTLGSRNMGDSRKLSGSHHLVRDDRPSNFLLLKRHPNECVQVIVDIASVSYLHRSKY